MKTIVFFRLFQECHAPNKILQATLFVEDRDIRSLSKYMEYLLGLLTRVKAELRKLFYKGLYMNYVILFLAILDTPLPPDDVIYVQDNRENV